MNAKWQGQPITLHIIFVLQLKKKFARTVEQTRFSGAPIVPIAAAAPGGTDSASSATTIGISKLVEVNIGVKSTTYSEKYISGLSRKCVPSNSES